jgi:hypothetical protein
MNGQFVIFCGAALLPVRASSASRDAGTARGSRQLAKRSKVIIQQTDYAVSFLVSWAGSERAL